LVFKKMTVWVRVLDLPLDMMNKVYAKLIGNWIGRYLSADVDEEGLAWGEELRIRVEIQVDKPLVRGVNLKESDEDAEGRWFDVKYERIPHFCFECGLLFHSAEGCKAEKGDVQQWGEWLRASLGRSRNPAPRHRPSVSTASYSSQSTGDEGSWRGKAEIRDLPPRRNLFRTQSESESSRTGGNIERHCEREVSSPAKEDKRGQGGRGKETADPKARKVKSGTYVRKQRKASPSPKSGQVRDDVAGPRSNKRRSTQVWVQKGSVEELKSKEKKQRVQSVFDRISDPNCTSASPVKLGRRAQ
jgi:hypothetical protein